MKRILAAAALLFLGLATPAPAQTQTGGAGGVTSVTCNGTTITASGNCGALTGDVTASAGSGATTLANIPAISGANLTGLNATNIASGTLAAARGGAGTITGALKGSGAGVVSQAACPDLSNGATGCSTATGTTGATIPLNSTANIFSALQTVNLNAASPPTAITGTALQVFNVDGVSGRLVAGSFGAIANVTVARADGTGASPTQVLSGEQIGGINSYGYGSAAWQGPLVSYRSYAAENIDSTHYGSKACIATTPLASTTMADVFCANSDGTLQINGNGIFGSTAAGAFRHGGLDVDTAPVAQIIRTQGALAGGTSNVAGANLTIIVSPGKGTGAGGSFIVQTAPAGSTGTTVNAPVTALTIASNQQATFSAQINASAGMNSASDVLVSGLTQVGPANGFRWSGRAYLVSPSDGNVTVRNNANSADGNIKAAAFVAGGSAPTLTGTCTTGTQVGGNTAGAFAATCVSQTVIITFAATAPNGWTCDFNDLTTPADSLKQTAYTTTSCTASGTTVAADTVTFHAVAF